MAGNIVKWWRQFKQYKQFSVLQECQTDSEDLIPSKSTAMKDQNRASVEDIHQSLKVKTCNASENALHENRGYRAREEKLQKRHSIATSHQMGILDENLDETRVKLDGFTCDVSLEDAVSSKSQPPIQFSFTLYDVDGCGKITKDDIAGIVSTIYENIGNTVVVPHYGKKTINVKLTVSPDTKYKQQSSKEQSYKTREHKKLQLEAKQQSKSHRFISDDENVDEESDSVSENLVAMSEIRNDTMAKTIGKTIDKNNVYESINNLKHYNPTHPNLISRKNIKNIEVCKSCKPNYVSGELHVEGNGAVDSRQQKIGSKKKILRKSKTRRHRPSEARMRSLSVGNDQKWRLQDEKELNQKSNESYQLKKSNNLRRNELIEIIKDSLEKNCFQAKRKTDDFSGEHSMRQRSNTVACTDSKIPQSNYIDAEQQHLCAFDSFLHATICSNNLPADSAKIQLSKMNNSKKIKEAPALSKLKTSVLNQLNPNLTPEQKLTRKLNDVEKWLLEHESSAHTCTILNEKKARLRENKNLLNPEVLNKLTTQQCPNKESKITKKMKHPTYQTKQQKEILNTSKNQKFFDNIPVLADFTERENLLVSDGDETLTEISTNKKVEGKQEASSDSMSSHVLSNLIVHHIHHFYFDEKE